MGWRRLDRGYSEAQVRAEVVSFWFDQLESSQWWSAEPAVDDEIRRRFLRIMQRAACGELYPWRTTPAGRLAEILLLDQFSRNVYRDTPQAFAQDASALVLAQEAVASGALTSLAPIQCAFVLMPYLHSESRLIHVAAEALFRDFTPPAEYEHELRHKAVIDRFGRYPHRNGLLGRASTSAESEFLDQSRSQAREGVACSGCLAPGASPQPTAS